LTFYGQYTYIYDCENQLIEVREDSNTIATYAYDFAGRRMSKTLPASQTTIQYMYDGVQVIIGCENRVFKRRYFYGPGIDEPVCMLYSGDMYYYHYDGLGSVAALSNEDGGIAERYSYDVFGKPTIRDSGHVTRDSSAFGNRYMFTGRRYDIETDLYYYRARYYSPELGRFLQPDPIGYAAGLNLYTYCDNDPVSLVDPYGLVCGSKYTDWIVPDHYGDADFTSACQNHDDCYGAHEDQGGCDTSKHNCDKGLFFDMVKECNRAYAKNEKMRKKCKNRAYTYFEWVRDKGQGAFDRARKEAGCDCDDSKK